MEQPRKLFKGLICDFQVSKICKKGHIEMTKKIYPEPLKVGLGCSISHYSQLFSIHFSWRRSTRCSDRLNDFSVTIPRCYKDVYVNSFFPPIARLWDSRPKEWFPLTYNLNGFKSRINRYLLTVGFF